MKNTVTSYSIINEFYLLPSIVLYKSKNEHTHWIEIRVNLFIFEFELNYYYGGS